MPAAPDGKGRSGVVGIGTCCLEKLTEYTSRYKILLLSRVPGGCRTVIKYATVEEEQSRGADAL